MLQRVIRDLDKQERRRPFVWIGYLVKTMLPNLGPDERECHEFLDSMLDQGVISASKTPNPNNPDFPATRVQLNHDEPRVKFVLVSSDHELNAAARQEGMAVLDPLPP